MTVYLRCSEAFSKKRKGTKIRYPTYRKRIGRTAGLIYGRPYVSHVLLSFPLVFLCLFSFLRLHPAPAAWAEQRRPGGRGSAGTGAAARQGGAAEAARPAAGSQRRVPCVAWQRAQSLGASTGGGGESPWALAPSCGELHRPGGGELPR